MADVPAAGGRRASTVVRLAAATIVLALIGWLAWPSATAPPAPAAPAVPPPASVSATAASAGDAASIIALTAAYTPEEAGWLARFERAGAKDVPPAAIDFVKLHRSGADRATQVAFIRDHFADHPAVARAALDWIGPDPAQASAAATAAAQPVAQSPTPPDQASATHGTPADLPSVVGRPHGTLPPEYGAGGGHPIPGFQVQP
jgi:hypothetical protein